MQRHSLLAAFIAFSFLVGGTLSARAAGGADAQMTVAKRFITAYLRQDTPTVRQCIPTKFDNLFGPYPFVGAVTLARPKVHKTQALVEFTATIAEKQIPSRGGILLHEQDGVWRVRQVLYYDRVPRIFNLPTKSTTAKDQRQEPEVKRVAEKFLDKWKAGDRKTMEMLWSDWTDRNQDKVQGLTTSDLVVKAGAKVWNAPYYTYTVKVSYKLGPLVYSIVLKGGVILDQEGDQWKVRPNELVFDF